MSETSSPAAPAAELGIRDRINAFTKPGKIIPVPVEGLGKVPIKILSYGQILDLPDELSGAHHTVAAVMDEKGDPLFKSIDDLRAIHPGVADRLVSACLQTSTTLTVADAEKK